MTWNRSLLFYKCQPKHFISTYSLLYSHKNDVKIMQNFQYNKPVVILGIESSCDETGCGIVDSTGTILGEGINSQYLTHSNFGGIVPTIAQIMHKNNITKTCEDALRNAGLKLKDIDAIATTVKPGIELSLNIGIKFGKYLAKIGNKPFIPINHMEAHALTARMKEKIARRLRLRNIPEFRTLNGGSAIEYAASKATDIDQFTFLPILTQYRNCNFSFSGLLNKCKMYIASEEEKHKLVADMVIPDVYNLCAALQLAVITHICQRTQRAMEFINRKRLFPKGERKLIISGGVACNNLLSKALKIVCSDVDYKFIRTPPKLCTDNGVMIAWNGVEKWKTDTDIIRDPYEINNIKAEGSATFGEDWTQKVESANIKCQWSKIKRKLY
nr:PREDICTED: probable tRNA N6-adenosine threonylcarbamoyltransferase, mitochondrial isoform X2 [Megachile rotundata]